MIWRRSPWNGGGIHFPSGTPVQVGCTLSVSMPVRMMALKVAKVLPPSGLPVLSGVRLREIICGKGPGPGNGPKSLPCSFLRNAPALQSLEQIAPSSHDLLIASDYSTFLNTEEIASESSTA